MLAPGGQEGPVVPSAKMPVDPYRAYTSTLLSGSPGWFRPTLLPGIFKEDTPFSGYHMIERYIQMTSRNHMTSGL